MKILVEQGKLLSLHIMVQYMILDILMVGCLVFGHLKQLMVIVFIRQILQLNNLILLYEK